MASLRTLQSHASLLRNRGSEGLQALQQQGEILKQHGQVYLERGQVYWSQNGPKNTFQWMVFAGAAMLALSVLSTVLMIVSAFLLVAAWIGLVMFSITVFMCTFAALFCGWAMILFSGFCAVMGTTILSAAAGLYVAMEAATRLKTVGMHYIDTMQQSTGKLQYKPQLARAAHVGQPGLDGSTAAPYATEDASRLDQLPDGVRSATCPANGAAATTASHNNSTNTSTSGTGTKATAATHGQMHRQTVSTA